MVPTPFQMAKSHMAKTESIRPEGHVLVPAAAIGGLSAILAAGLEAIHMLDRVDTFLADSISKGATAKLIFLPGWMIWLPGLVLAFLIPLAILNVPGTWRRAVLWITAIVLVAGWAPVLYLASRSPDVAPPLIITIWSGVCALVYAGNHRMPCDEPVLPAAGVPSPPRP